MPSSPEQHPSRPAVTVLGLGPMGRALAGAFLDAGVRTTVWNRTPGREGDLAARGALVAASAEEAVAASPLTVICLVNYDATDSVLRRPAVTDALKGRTVANLSADVPGRSRDTGRWAAEHGVGYLDGAVMTPAPTIGSPEGVFLYAGPEPLYVEHRPVLDALGGSHTHLGEDIGRAAAYDVALLDLFWTSMTGYVHALALARAEGITAREFAPFAAGIATIQPPLFEEWAGDVDERTYPGTINPLTSGLSTMEHVVHAAEDHGLDASVMRAAAALTRRALDRGHGADGFTRVTELLDLR